MKSINKASMVNNVSLIVRQGRYTRDFFAIALFHDAAEQFIDSLNGGDNEWIAFEETINYLEWLPVGRGSTATDALQSLDGKIKALLDKQVKVCDLMYSSLYVAEEFYRARYSAISLPKWCRCIKEVVSREDEFKNLLAREKDDEDLF